MILISTRKILKHSLAVLWPNAMMIKGKSADGRVALTFDDGPHPENTQYILDILDSNGATATFFLQGSEAEKYPELTREIFARGHQIGNHGYAHLDAKQTSLCAYIKDINHAQDTLQYIIGVQIEKLFRPPFGNITGMAFILLALDGYRFVFWSVDSRDSFIQNTGELVTHIRSMNIISGDILLFHEDYFHTVIVLPEVLQSLHDCGLSFSKIAEI